MDCVTKPELEITWKRSFRRRLLSWYAKHERDLPWRRNRDPYRVWISEVMLQQTQVATVRPYFERFLAAFPNVKTLADADEEQVLRMWEGLGYYRRARQLHAAARLLTSQYRGQFPREVTELRKLPGIGRYTAGAIASIAFDERAPILEANTVRLLSRLVAYRADPSKSVGQKLLWRTAEAVLPRQDVARFNQALMELGALICKPTNPRCEDCPVANLCVARAEDAVDQIPAVSRKLGYVESREVAVVVRKQRRMILRRCADGERWAGLWDFPRFELSPNGPLSAEQEIISKVRAITGVTCRPGSLLKTIRHGVTRFRITLDCYAAEFDRGRLRSTSSNPVRWVPGRALADYPLSSTGRKISSLVVKLAGAGDGHRVE